MDVSGTQKTLSGLNSLTTYSIYVVAVNRATEGGRSPVTQNTTFGGQLYYNSSYMILAWA